MSVDRDRQAFEPSRIKGLPRAIIGGILDEDALSWIKQHVGAKRQGLLRTGQDDDPIRCGARAPFQIHIVCNRTTKRLGALGVSVKKRLGAVLFQHLSLQALPERERKVARLRQAWRERPGSKLFTHAAAAEHGGAALAEVRR
ncbi:hypothetical protein D3C81_1920430 [compost metagenome]